jgi:hypothetical protein
MSVEVKPFNWGHAIDSAGALTQIKQIGMHVYPKARGAKKPAMSVEDKVFEGETLMVDII